MARTRKPDPTLCPSLPISEHRRAIAYVRVSTQQQGISGLGLDAQQSAIAAECHRRGLECTETLSDVESGAKWAREGLDEALRRLRAREFDILVVAKVDRLSRSLLHFLEIFERSRAEHWQLIVCDLPIQDLYSPMGEMMITLLAQFAALERSMIRTRTREALAAAKARGTTIGRRSVQIPEAVQELVENCRRSGRTVQETCYRLNMAGVPTLTGKLCWTPGGTYHVMRRLEEDRARA